MFLVPTSSPGFERQPLPTIADETTNISYYSDIRLPDRYRIGEVNNGWSILHGPLDVEHHLGEHESKLDAVGPGAGLRAKPWRGRSRPPCAGPQDAPAGDGPMVGDETFLAGIGHLLIEIEGSACTPTAMGKMKSARTPSGWASSELIDLVGPAATLAHGADGAIGDGIIEFGHRYAQTARPPAARSRCSGPSSPSTTWASRARITPAAGCS